MATLTVWKFNTPEGADTLENSLQRLQRSELVQIVDAAVVTWKQGDKQPKTRQLTNVAAAGALGGAFWGMLFGLLFFVPLLGLAVGAAMGAITGAMTDVGIDDKMIKSLREKITPGTSALFLMTSKAVPDKLGIELKNELAGAELIESNLSLEQEAQLRELLGLHDVMPADEAAPAAPAT